MSVNRSIAFTIPGKNGGVNVTATEMNGDIVFDVQVNGGKSSASDLRALFFQFDEGDLPGLTITDASSTLTNYKIAANNVIDMGNGANMQGAASPFDIGLVFGTAGKGQDPVSSVKFTLHGAQPLTLDDLANQQMGARLTSQGEKLTAVVPAAPDAKNDTYHIFEDGQPDLNSPSHAPLPVTFDVLSNDTDLDPAAKLTITAADGALHGTVKVVDNKVIYTPNSDFNGADNFTYDISDGHGGKDSASVHVDVEAVADVPKISYKFDPGNSVNQILLTVTGDTSGGASEYIDRISLDGLPAGVTVSEVQANSGNHPGEFSHQFLLTLPANTSEDFDLQATAVAKEISNGDEQSAQMPIHIVNQFTHTSTVTTFEAKNQSIWSSGTQYTLNDDRFLGGTVSWDKSADGFLYGHTDGNIKAGFQSTLNFNGGGVNASAPFSISVDSNYNKATDVLDLSASNQLQDVTFNTTGPSGSYKLDFILNYLINASAGIDLAGKHPLINVNLSNDYDIPFIDLKSSDPTKKVNLGSGISLDVSWPNVNTKSNASASPTSHGESNNFLQLNVSVFDLLTKLLKLPVNPLDPGFSFGIDGVLSVSGDAELAKLTLDAGLNFLQDFALAVSSLTGTIKFEDNTTQSFDFAHDIILQNAKSHDANHDGRISYDITLTPSATLTNKTSLGFNVGYDFEALKLTGSYDTPIKSGSASLGPVYSTSDSTPVTSVGIYDKSFALNFGSQDLSLAA